MTHKSKPQLNPKVKKLFTGTEVGALLENVDYKLGTIIEGQQTIERKIDTLAGKHHQVEQRVTKAEIRLDTLEAK